MLTKLSETLKPYAKGWIILLLLALDVFFNAVVLPRQLAQMQAASGGIGPIDLRFFYTPDQAYAMIDAYGGIGRADYRFFELTGDILYPIVYTLFFSLAMTWLFQRGLAKANKVQHLNVVPFGAWLFDLLENLAIVTLLSIYPSQPALLAWLATTFTMIKWLFVGATILLLSIGLVTLVRKTFQSNKKLERRALRLP